MNNINILTEKRELYPINYPEFVKYHEKILFSHWTHHELEIEPDILDWIKNLSFDDKRVIGNVFKAFTEQESIVNDYWRNIVADKFRHPEIVHTAVACSHQESIHELAYDFLESNLPMSQTVTTEWKADPVASKKLNDILCLKNNLDNLASSLAVFSGFVEGVSLYSSFAVLLSFTKKGYLKTMAQILSWSARDEDNHSEIGIKLFHQLLKEGYPLDKNSIYIGAKIIVENEILFIKNAFGNLEKLETISLDEIISFIRHRGNRKLMELNLKPIFSDDGKHKNLSNFFYTTIEGKSMNDFFAQSRNGGAYSSTLNQNFGECVFNV